MVQIFTEEFTKGVQAGAARLFMEDGGVPGWVVLPAMVLFLLQLILWSVGKTVIPFLLDKAGAYLEMGFPGVNYTMLAPWWFLVVVYMLFALVCLGSMMFYLYLIIMVAGRVWVERKAGEDKAFEAWAVKNRLIYPPESLVKKETIP